MEIPMTKMVLMATAFSKNSMMGMVIVALVCMGIPFIALAYMKTKTGAKISSFLKGLLFYALFAFGVSGLINILLLGGLSLSSVLNRSIHPVYYAVYGAVLAGIVEETGKFVGLKYMMKKNPDKQNALLFGLGHGGLEALAYGSSLFMGNFVLALLVNSLGVDEYFNKLGITGEKLVEQKNNLAALMAIPTSEYVAYGIERVFLLALQIALTILVFMAVNNRKLKPMFPIAILLHIIAYMPSYLNNMELLNLTFNLLITGAVCVIVAAYVYRIYHQISDDGTIASKNS